MGAFTRGAVRGGRSVGNKILNLDNYGSSFLDHATRPLEFFGFSNQYGALSKGNRAWSFAGMRFNMNTGRHWIQDFTKQGIAEKSGRWGTFGELLEHSNKARATIGGWKGVSGQIRMLGGRFAQPLATSFFIGLGIHKRRQEGKGVLRSIGGAVAEEGTMALGARLLLPQLANPIVLAGAAVAIGGLGYMMYRDKMARYGRKAGKTEFVGDMSAFQTNAAVTMRQRSMQSIQRSFLNARTALGGEARYQHLGAY